MKMKMEYIKIKTNSKYLNDTSTKPLLNKVNKKACYFKLYNYILSLFGWNWANFTLKPLFPSLGVIWVQISAPLTLSDNIFRRGGQTDGQCLWDTSNQTLQHRRSSAADFTQKSNLRTQRTQGVTLQPHTLYQFWRRTAPLFNPVWWILDC